MTASNNAELLVVTIEFYVKTTDQKFADLSENQPPINFKRLIGLKIFLVKYPSVPRGQ